ncbi:hypothetical protein GTQ40_05720 [Flavobacteriaceae bacterium R38]|nr:hypothetical protein [Flavobacteriaceae bacterium R38]
MKKITPLIIAGFAPVLLFWGFYSTISQDMNFLFFVGLITLFLVSKWQSKCSINIYLKLFFLITPFSVVFYSFMLEKTIVLWMLIPIITAFTIAGSLIKKRGTTIFFGAYAILIGITTSLVVLPEITRSDEVSEQSFQSSKNKNTPIKNSSGCNRKKKMKTNCYL